jgi:hypothetical protein
MTLKKNGAQCGMHIFEDEDLYEMIRYCQAHGLPYATVGKIALDFAWRHFEKEVIALAEKKLRDTPPKNAFLTVSQQKKRITELENALRNNGIVFPGGE